MFFNEDLNFELPRFAKGFNASITPCYSNLAHRYACFLPRLRFPRGIFKWIAFSASRVSLCTYLWMLSMYGLVPLVTSVRRQTYGEQVIVFSSDPCHLKQKKKNLWFLKGLISNYNRVACLRGCNLSKRLKCIQFYTGNFFENKKRTLT